MAFSWRTGQAIILADLAGVHRPLFSFGDWIGLGPGDAPLGLRDLSTEEILSWPFKRD